MDMVSSFYGFLYSDTKGETATTPRGKAFESESIPSENRA